jgi:hypothetical protein
MINKTLCLALLLLAGCEPHHTPPARLMYGSLPVTGSLADARRAGFTDCVQPDYVSMRCRKHKVMVDGTGPYEAAVDLVGGDGSGGFDQVVLWHDRDQYAVYKITDMLDHTGWQSCNTGVDEKGDQMIYSRKGARVRISMDLSYWGKRRLRILPAWNTRERRC